MTPIDIFMAVPLVLVPLCLALTFIYGVYQEYQTIGVIMLILFSWFFVGLIYYAKPAHSATATLDMRANLILDCVRQDMEGITPVEQLCAERGECCDYEPITEVQFSSAGSE